MSQSPFDQLKYQYKYGGNTMKFLFWNVGIYLSLSLAMVIGYLFNEKLEVKLSIYKYLIAHTDINELIKAPWTVFTYMWTHVDFFHLAFNMLMLYFIGKMFERIVGNSRFAFVYIASGLVGYLIHAVAINVFPAFDGMHAPILGASGAIMGIFIGLVTLAPNQKIHFFGLFPVRLLYLGVIYVLLDILRIGDGGNTAYFSHIGGALFGFVYGYAYLKGTDIAQWFKFSWAKNLFKRRSKIRVAHSNVKSTAKKHKDDEFNATKANRQAKIDAILDKIKDSGYDSLSKSEKAFLFKESKNV